MLYDARNLTPDWFAERSWDLAICGAGPAGISLARRVAGQGFRVLLLEGGGTAPHFESQVFYEGESVGREYFGLDETRLRALGGSSNHWNGWCRPLDARDFRPRPDHPLSGWPIDRDALDPYAAETERILDLGPEPDPVPSPVEGRLEGFHPVAFRWSTPVTRFNAKYVEELRASQEIDLVIRASALEALPNERGDAVRRIRLAHPEDEWRAEARARAFVLCLGGLENPRFLLNSRGAHQEGLGNDRDQVGRYFNEHPHFHVGEAVLRRPFAHMRFVSPDDDLLLGEGVLNFAMRFISLLPARHDGSVGRSRLARAVCNSEAEWSMRLAEALRGGRELDCRDVRLQIVTEQELNPDSRVTLAENRDPFGQRRLRLDWRLADRDLHTIRRGARLVAEALAHSDLGRARLDPWVLDEGAPLPGLDEDEVAGHHQMCTTRMSANPAEGVVDADCRVHGFENLYLGGSSVFATGGHANPTYTIVQLALRLGDHLADRLSDPARLPLP